MTGNFRGLILFAPLALGGCEWFSDFKRQPTISTWEVVGDSTRPSRGNPQGSVPVTGQAVSGFEVSYAAMPATIDSMAGLRNPKPQSDSSIANGHKYYQINCAVCHGDRGIGDGPVTQFGMPGINIVSDITKSRTDGYLFGMIRNGRGLMPPYNRIEELDRWDVVNYLRGLQGMSGRAVAVGPLAAPGVTGDKLPGASETAPTRPAPFFKPTAAAAAAHGASPAASHGAAAAGAHGITTVPSPNSQDSSIRADSGSRGDTSARRGGVR